LEKYNKSASLDKTDFVKSAFFGRFLPKEVYNQEKDEDHEAIRYFERFHLSEFDEPARKQYQILFSAQQLRKEFFQFISYIPKDDDISFQNASEIEIKDFISSHLHNFMRDQFIEAIIKSCSCFAGRTGGQDSLRIMKNNLLTFMENDEFQIIVPASVSLDLKRVVEVPNLTYEITSPVEINWNQGFKIQSKNYWTSLFMTVSSPEQHHLDFHFQGDLLVQGSTQIWNCVPFFLKTRSVAENKKRYYYYCVDISTASKIGSGTDGTVFVKITGQDKEGQEYESERIPLSAANSYRQSDLFERGQTDTFYLKVERPFGALKNVEVSIESGDEWMFDWVIVSGFDLPAPVQFKNTNKLSSSDSSVLLSPFDAGDAYGQKRYYYYCVDISTASKIGSGTDGTVFVKITGQDKEGQEYESERIPLSAANSYRQSDLFERGQTDTFYLKVERPFGALKNVEVSIESGDEWMFDWVIVSGFDLPAPVQFKNTDSVQLSSSNPLVVLPVRYTLRVITNGEDQSHPEVTVTLEGENEKESGAIKLDHVALISKNTEQTLFDNDDKFEIRSYFSLGGIKHITLETKNHVDGKCWNLLSIEIRGGDLPERVVCEPTSTPVSKLNQTVRLLPLESLEIDEDEYPLPSNRDHYLYRIELTPQVSSDTNGAVALPHSDATHSMEQLRLSSVILACFFGDGSRSVFTEFFNFQYERFVRGNLWLPSTYENGFKTNSELAELATSPFMMQVLVNILPELQALKSMHGLSDAKKALGHIHHIYGETWAPFIIAHVNHNNYLEKLACAAGNSSEVTKIGKDLFREFFVTFAKSERFRFQQFQQQKLRQMDFALQSTQLIEFFDILNPDDAGVHHLTNRCSDFGQAQVKHMHALLTSQDKETKSLLGFLDEFVGKEKLDEFKKLVKHACDCVGDPGTNHGTNSSKLIHENLKDCFLEYSRIQFSHEFFSMIRHGILNEYLGPNNSCALFELCSPQYGNGVLLQSNSAFEECGELFCVPHATPLFSPNFFRVYDSLENADVFDRLLHRALTVIGQRRFFCQVDGASGFGIQWFQDQNSRECIYIGEFKNDNTSVATSSSQHDPASASAVLMPDSAVVRSGYGVAFWPNDCGYHIYMGHWVRNERSGEGIYHLQRQIDANCEFRTFHYAGSWLEDKPFDYIQNIVELPSNLRLTDKILSALRRPEILRVVMYQYFSEHVLHQTSARMKIHRQDIISEAVHYSRIFADHLSKNNISKLSRSDRSKLFGDAHETDKFFSDEENAAAAIRIAPISTGYEFSFIHDSLKDYFASEHVVHQVLEAFRDEQFTPEAFRRSLSMNSGGIPLFWQEFIGVAEAARSIIPKAQRSNDSTGLVQKGNEIRSDYDLGSFQRLKRIIKALAISSLNQFEFSEKQSNTAVLDFFLDHLFLSAPLQAHMMALVDLCKVNEAHPLFDLRVLKKNLKAIVSQRIPRRKGRCLLHEAVLKNSFHVCNFCKYVDLVLCDSEESVLHQLDNRGRPAMYYAFIDKGNMVKDQLAPVLPPPAVDATALQLLEAEELAKATVDKLVNGLDMLRLALDDDKYKFESKEFFDAFVKDAESRGFTFKKQTLEELESKFPCVSTANIRRRRSTSFNRPGLISETEQVQLKRYIKGKSKSNGALSRAELHALIERCKTSLEAPYADYFHQWKQQPHGLSVENEKILARQLLLGVSEIKDGDSNTKTRSGLHDACALGDIAEVRRITQENASDLQNLLASLNE
jgi:hypothetical protein